MATPSSSWSSASIPSCGNQDLGASVTLGFYSGAPSAFAGAFRPSDVVASGVIGSPPAGNVAKDPLAPMAVNVTEKNAADVFAGATWKPVGGFGGTLETKVAGQTY